MIIKNPLVSVVMPVYNADEYLAESIESILSQTFSNIEFIIICDSPSVNTITIIDKYQSCDKRIQVIYQKRAGLISSLNKGFSIARGKYIARMDADDISHPDRLQKQVSFMDMNPECSLVGSHIEYIDESGKFLGYWDADIKTKNAQDVKKRLPIKNCIAHPTVMIRQCIINKYPYDPSQINAEDYDVWLRMASDSLLLCKLPEFLLKYRKQPLSVSKKVMPVTLRIKCKTRYLCRQAMNRKISQFNLNVLFFLIVDIITWPFFFTYSKIFNKYEILKKNLKTFN